MAEDFDPDRFMDGASEGEFSTRVEPCPEGTYLAQVESKEFRKAGDATIFRVRWEILDDDVREALGRDRVFVNQDIWLDVDDNGALDARKGKNVGLGRLYAALGINRPGVRPRDVDGQATVLVSHRSDKNDPEIKYDQVSRVAAA